MRELCLRLAVHCNVYLIPDELTPEFDLNSEMRLTFRCAGAEVKDDFGVRLRFFFIRRRFSAIRSVNVCL